MGFPGKSTGVGCHFLLQCMKVKSESDVAQSCPTLSDPMDCSSPGFSIHGIFQARVLEWGAIAFSITFIDRENNLGHRRTFPLRYKTNQQTKTNSLLHTISQLKQSKCESGKKTYPGILTANQVNVSSFL